MMEGVERDILREVHKGVHVRGTPIKASKHLQSHAKSMKWL